jgi:transposase
MGGDRLQRHPGAPTRCRSVPQAELSRRKKEVIHPPDEALGRSQGGFSTKLDFTCDGRGRRSSVVLTLGRRHKSIQRGRLLDASPGAAFGRGTVAQVPFSADCRRRLQLPTLPETLEGAPHPTPSHGGAMRGSESRSVPDDLRASTELTSNWRNVVERCVNRVKQWRGIATRYEKRAVSFRAAVVVA